MIQFKPDDKIIITNDVWWPENPGITYVCDAIKGSIARIMSFEEFCEYHKNHYVPFCVNPDDQWVKEGMESGRFFPIQFEYIAPLKDKGENDKVECEVGRVFILNVKDFMKYDAKGNETSICNH